MEESPPSSSSDGRVDVVTDTMNQLKVAEEGDDGSRVQVTCFSEVVNDATLYFQIIRLQNQVFVAPLLQLTKDYRYAFFYKNYFVGIKFVRI